MSKRRSNDPEHLADQMDLVSRSLNSIGYAEGLYPAQWTALRYFAKASSGSRTASDLARFQGLASGPVSRTVRTLIQKQLIRKAQAQPVGRAEHLEVSDKGYEVLGRDPIQLVIAAIAEMPSLERDALEKALRGVVEVASKAWPRVDSSQIARPAARKRPGP
jgi:DNA-binding MarR family transcriptional regulator